MVAYVRFKDIMYLNVEDKLKDMGFENNRYIGNPDLIYTLKFETLSYVGLVLDDIYIVLAIEIVMIILATTVIFKLFQTILKQTLNLL